MTTGARAGTCASGAERPGTSSASPTVMLRTRNSSARPLTMPGSLGQQTRAKSVFRTIIFDEIVRGVFQLMIYVVSVEDIGYYQCMIGKLEGREFLKATRTISVMLEDQVKGQRITTIQGHINVRFIPL